jgi:hypothetical protein
MGNENNLVSENAEGQLVISDEGEVTAEVQASGLPMDKLKRFAELSRKAKVIKADADAVNDEMKQLESIILMAFEREGVQNMKVDGMTLYLHSQVWASAKDGDKDGAMQALKANGLGHFVQESFNTQTLSAWVRERQAAVAEAVKNAERCFDAGDIEGYSQFLIEAAEADIPEAVKAALHISDKPGVRARKG